MARKGTAFGALVLSVWLILQVSGYALTRRFGDSDVPYGCFDRLQGIQLLWLLANIAVVSVASYYIGY